MMNYEQLDKLTEAKSNIHIMKSIKMYWNVLM